MRTTKLINDNWFFKEGTLDTLPEPPGPGNGVPITLPHDWAVDGPMSGWREPANVNGSLVQGGETGGLPYQGGGCYERNLFIPEYEEGKLFRVEFDGVMSHASVYVNGKLAGRHVYGYTSFALDITPLVHFGIKPNKLVVEVNNPPYLCRWYPGAGIYRDVRVVAVDADCHFNYGGLQLLTENLDVDARTATLRVVAEGVDDSRLAVTVSRNGAVVAKGGSTVDLKDLELWSPESPALYDVDVTAGDDRESLRYGFRQLDFRADGMSLNGQPYRFKGLCMHHDLGIFGAAFHEPVMRWRLKKIKALGCNALRMAHNPPDPKLLALCDELGFFVMDEAFDVWQAAKTPGDYHIEFDQCHARDLRDFIRRDRNHPSVALWSIGNEIREEALPTSAAIAAELCAICHEEDPTRPVTAACSHHLAEDNPALDAFLNALDVIGWNYKPDLFPLLRKRFPDKPQLCSETSAVLSTRGEYIPDAAVACGNVRHDSGYPSAYATEHCTWSNGCEAMFQALEDNPWLLGEFAWCTYEYLGEPAPYTWPNRSSCFALFDFACLPKDRSWLYAAQWRQDDMPHVLHIAAHWEWPAGTKVPVQVFTSCHSVELILNGESLGVRQRGHFPRMDWGLLDFKAGSLEAVGRDAAGRIVARDARVTPEAPAHIAMDVQSERGEGGAFIFVGLSLTDAAGNPVRTSSAQLTLAVSGKAQLCGVDNGDSRCHLPFKRTSVALFHGRALVTLFAKGPGTLTVSGAGCQNQIQFP